MAKFVLAGTANCPYFAKAELLADNLKTNLPDFKLHKIVKHPDEWEKWLSDICESNGWVHSSSPLIWRELINRGGKGTLIGGSNDFQEYAAGYYGISSSMLSSDMSTVSSENMETHLSVTAEAELVKSQSKPLNICITNASSPVVYHMLHEIASGDVLGREIELGIRLLVGEEETDAARGAGLETIDLAFPLLQNISVTSDPNEAINKASLIIIMDDLTQKETESWEDWIKRCGSVYINYGSVISNCAVSDCKVIVAGTGPTNLGAYLIKHEAKNILRQNIIVPSRLPENRAKSAIARRIHVNSSGVVDIIVWGNPGGTTHLDLSKGRVHGCEGAIWGPPSFSRPIKDMVHDDKWLHTEYLQTLKTHKEMLEGVLGHSAAVSEAHSVVATVTDWFSGDNDVDMYSMGVISDGCYEVPEDLVFSLPVKFQRGSWRVVEDVSITSELRDELAKIVDELEREIQVIFPSPNKNKETSEAVDQTEAGGDNREKVFGMKEGSKDSPVVSDALSPVDGEENDISRGGPLSRIAEESETDTKEGTTVTETDKEE